MISLTRTFYSYLSLHSLLIGVFPFFLPVYLWNQGFKLGEISIFIGISGFAFCIALWVWDHIRQSISLLNFIGISLVLETNLLLTVFLLPGENWIALSIVAISYGTYNCFFWTTQRALFFERVNSSNSGRNYGNLQMYVGLVLQIGILIGGLLLEKYGFSYVLAFSVISSVIGFTLIAKNIDNTTKLNQFKPLNISDIFTFKDSHSSVPIFLIDGLYLFLESFFWLISLYLLAHESFLTLGLTVMSLAIIFAVIFYFLKNVIDRFHPARIYRVAVVLYAFSWLLRANVKEDQPLFWLFVALVLITFCTTFFRLAMNKRFYDLARETLNHRYLILKSYYSQFVIGVVFVVAGLLIKDVAHSETLLIPSYYLGAILAFIFLLYGAAYAKSEHTKETSGEIVNDN